MKTIIVNKVNNKLPFQLEIFQLTKTENGYLKQLIKGVDVNTSLILEDNMQISEKLGLIKVTILRRSKLSKLKEAKIRLFPNTNFFNFDKIKVEKILGPNYETNEILSTQTILNKKILDGIFLINCFELDLKSQLDNLNDEYYFVIKPVNHKKMDIFVDTESTKCAKIYYEYQDIDITTKDTKFYNINFLNHILNTNLNNGVYTLKRPLVSLSGKKLSCNLSINYNNNSLSEIIDDTFYTGLPNGWLFNYQQYLIKNNEQYYYINGDSQVLKFKMAENDLYIEESGSGLILKIEENHKIIQDLNHITYIFKEDYLVEINKGRYSITINYETIENNKRRIYKITDSSNRQINIEYTSNRIRIYGQYNHEIGINIVNDMIDVIYEIDNYNPINHNSYYSYNEELLLSKIQTRGYIDEARISYANNKLSKIEQYKNDKIEETIQFDYQTKQNTSTTTINTSNQNQSTVTYKYYFDENRKFTRSVEIVNGKEYNEKLNQTVEEQLFIELDKEEHLFVNNIYESPNYKNGEEYKVCIPLATNNFGTTSIEGYFSTIYDEPISTLSDKQDVEIQVVPILSFAQFVNYSNASINPLPNHKDYYLKLSLKIKNSNTNQYEEVITNQTIFECNIKDFVEGTIEQIIKDTFENYISLTKEQNQLLNRSKGFKIDLESRGIMAVDKLILNLVVKSKKYPIYYVEQKIASTCTDKIMLFGTSDYPQVDSFTEGYGLLEYPNKITYKTNEGQNITLDHIKLTINDILVNKNKYYSGIKNIFYYNNLQNVITNYQTNEIYIENNEIKANPYFLTITIANYIKNEDNTISKTFIMNDYMTKDNRNIYVTQNVTIYNKNQEQAIDENNEDLYYSNNVSVYDSNLNIQEEITYYNKFGSLNNLLDVRKIYEYDEIGNVKNISITTGKKISYTYDELGNFVESSTITYDNDEETNIEHTYTYDKYGNLLSETNPLQQTTSYLYSSYFKELVEVKQGNSKNTLTYQYNLLKNIKNKNQMTYAFIYDAKENLKSINYKTTNHTYLFEEYAKILPTPNNVLGINSEEIGYMIEYYNCNRVAYAYDKYQNIISTYLFNEHLDGFEKTSDFIYGEEELNDNTSIYDVNDRYDARIIKHEASLLRKVYDYLENVKYIYRYNKDYILICIEKYQINDEQNETNIITKKEFTYKNNKLESKTIKDVTYGERQSIITNYQYNNEHLLEQEILKTKYDNQAVTKYEYDIYQRIKKVTIPSLKEEYTYENDHIATYKVNEKTYIPTYDKLDRIIKIEDENQFTDTYTYNDLGYLIEEKNKDNYKIIYSYDNEANIVSKKQYGIDNTIINQTNYIYDTDDKNKLIQVVENGTTIDINYNYNFNISSYRNLKFEYERGKLLKKVTKNENEIYQYYYNANGQRYKKTHDTITTEYIYEEGKLLKELVLGKTTPLYEINYLYNQLKVFGFEYNGEVYTYEYDIIGNIIGIYDNNSQIVARYKYDAYGNHQILNPDKTINDDDTFIGNINRIRYKGYYYDVETNLYWLSTRYYSPELCRFISPDSIEYLNPENINGLNLYAYCGNDPISYADPSGNLPFFILTAIIGAVIGVGITAVVDYIPDKEFDLHWGWYVGAGVLGAVIGAGIGMAVSYYATGSIASSTGQVFTGLFKSTSLYRSVGPDELADLKATGKFRQWPNSMEGKFFANSKKGAMKWGKSFNQSSYVKIRVPKSSLSNSTVNAMKYLDAIDDAFYFSDLGYLNSIVGKIWFL